ncbi:MAG: hydrogenase nickel incorporation protein HypB [Rhodomicrobiaceae bacterium]
MCESCGCSDGAKATVINLRTGVRTEVGHDHGGAGHHHHHDHEHAGHGHGHDHQHAHGHDHHHHHHDAHSHTVELGQAILQKNNELAARNAAWFAGREILALNLVSSPGAGKTTLLERTVREHGEACKFFVIEGDQETVNDAQRIQDAGAPAVQVNTGTGCHLEADMVARALKELSPSFGSVLMIENVGNLVCPALFDLGERAKVAIISVTEGEDKALKYPHMFQASSLVLVNKIDLLPHLNFDIDRCVDNIRKVNPEAEILLTSASSGEGMDRWYRWIDQQSAAIAEQAFM